LAIGGVFAVIAYYRDPGYISNALFNMAMAVIFHIMQKTFTEPK
jgi:hypothetical protein